MKPSPASLQQNQAAVALGFLAVTMALTSPAERIYEPLNSCSGSLWWQQICEHRQSCSQHELANGSLSPEQLFHDSDAGSFKAQSIS